MVLDHVVTGLQLSLPIAKLIPFIGPNLEGALDLALNICQQAQGARINKEETLELASHAGMSTITIVNHAKSKHPNSNDRRAIEDLQSVLKTISENLERRGKRRSWLARVFEKERDAGELASLRQRLQDATARFTIESLLHAENLQQEILTGVGNIQSGIENAETAHATSSLRNENEVLSLLRPIMDACHDSAQSPPGCLEHTREEILSDILKWLNDNSAENFIVWLSGLAGTGKTTIVKTVCELYEAQRGKKLIASFFISRRFADRRNPYNIIRTIAYQLARYVPVLSGAIRRVLQHDPDIVTRSFPELVRRLIAQPLASVDLSASSTTPIVIVIDALDECDRQNGQQDEQRLLLYHLAAALRMFSGSVKLIVTSRLERNIQNQFSTMNHSSYRLHDIDSDIVAQDVRRYLRHSFEKLVANRIDKFPKHWPLLEAYDILVDRTGPLFIYATTVVKYVSDEDYYPPDRLNTVLALGNLASIESPYSMVDSLYLQVLTSAAKNSQLDHPLCQRIRSIMGIVVLAQQPLSASSISSLLGRSVQEICIDLDKLSSVILVPSSDTDAVEIFHPSLPDFILDSTRCVDIRFHINAESFHGFLARRCLEVMISYLKYDICDIRHPTLLNKDVKDFPLRVVTHLPKDLAYACRYWVDHFIIASPTDSPMILTFQKFVRSHLLYWIEAMSLLQALSPAIEALKKLQTWWQMQSTKVSIDISLKRYPHNSDLYLRINDAERLVKEFYPALSQAALHLYHTALPLSPKNPALRQENENNAQRVRLVLERPDEWSATLQIITGHYDWINGLAYAPDGSRIASSSDDFTVRVWDVNTGGELLTLAGHDDMVYSVAYSSDGSLIISGSRDRSVRIWDARTGLQRLNLAGHTSSVFSVALSPDCKWIASGSYEYNVRIWATGTGEALGTLRGHTDAVSGVAFSSDGGRIASSSIDMTVRIWDTEQKTCVLTLRSDRTPMRCITFFGDDAFAIAGSDKGIYLWDTVNGTFVRELSGHTASVRAVKVSPDNLRIISGSDDRTIRVWDLKTGTQVAVLTGHTENVTSVVYSPDGRRIASASRDRTIRIWDADPAPHTQDPEKVHHLRVGCVAFSPDDTRVVACSNDCILSVWDVKSGELLRTIYTRTATSATMRDISFLPDRQLLFGTSSDYNAHLWNIEEGTTIISLTGHTGLVNCIDYAPSGIYIATASDDASIRLWDGTCNITRCIRVLFGHTGNVRSASFSQDSSHIVSGSDDKTVRLWHVESGQCIKKLEGHSDHVYRVHFSKNGHKIVSHSEDGVILEWNILTFAEDAEYREAKHDDTCGFRVTAAHAFPLRSGIHVVDGWLRVGYGLGERVCWLPVHRRPSSVTAVRLSSSGKMVAIGSASGTITVLELPKCFAFSVHEDLNFSD